VACDAVDVMARTRRASAARIPKLASRFLMPIASLLTDA
jgi:hypothetical protein